MNLAEQYQSQRSSFVEMFRLKVLIITFFIAVRTSKIMKNCVLELSTCQSAFCNDDGSEGREGWKRGKDKREKLKQCLQETKSLKDCCAYPNLLKNDDPECKHHLEGFEDKTEREQHRANACFTECMYKSRGLFTDGEFDKEKIRSQVGEKLVEKNEDEFKGIAISSIDKCFAESEQIFVLDLKVCHNLNSHNS